jgi:hypothetical protein
VNLSVREPHFDNASNLFYADSKQRMYTVNRSIAIISPKQLFADWANQLPDADGKVSLADLRVDCLAVLIPEYDSDEEARGHIGGIWEDLFEEALWGWSTKESWWPKERTQSVFWEWFDVEVHSVVIDPYEDQIKKEDL